MVSSKSPHQITGSDVQGAVGLAHAINSTSLHYRVGRMLLEVSR